MSGAAVDVCIGSAQLRGLRRHRRRRRHAWRQSQEWPGITARNP